ncbi:uromodulin-like isoform X1 [Ambystoma mexicanum]|uniref:uromodulin-like isoform X1 n=1 Tax=Ambystoma mexicanum TaxID=8296 RepID=UPI0037E95F2B
MAVWRGLTLTLGILITAAAQSPPCASDESFNAIANTCSCNLTMYITTDSLPTPSLHCLPDQMRLNLSKCQLERNRYDSENLHLLDPSCVGVQVNEDIAQIIINTSISSPTCGTSMTVNGSHVVYANSLMIPAKVSTSGIITRNNARLAFDCSYPLSMPVSLLTVLRPILGVIALTAPEGIADLEATLEAFTDSNFSVPYNQSFRDVYVDDPLYVSVKIDNLDAAFSLHVNRMYATPTNDTNAVPQIDLMTDGCPSADVADLVAVMNNGNTNEARFMMKVFKFLWADSVYLFTDVQVCSGYCIPVCSGEA